MDDLEFNNEQLTQIDKIDNAIWEVAKVITKNPDLKWNVEWASVAIEALEYALHSAGYNTYRPVIISDESNEYIRECWQAEGKEENISN